MVFYVYCILYVPKGMQYIIWIENTGFWLQIVIFILIHKVYSIGLSILIKFGKWLLISMWLTCGFNKTMPHAIQDLNNSITVRVIFCFNAIGLFWSLIFMPTSPQSPTPWKKIEPCINEIQTHICKKVIENISYVPAKPKKLKTLVFNPNYILRAFGTYFI